MKKSQKYKNRKRTVKQKSPVYVLALVISRVFDPFVTLGTASTIAVFRSGLSGWPLFFFLSGVVFATILLLAALLHWAIKKGHISNWDLSNRKERILPLFITIGILILDLMNARFFMNDYLVDLFTLFIFWSIGFFVVTVFWKISGHMAAITLMTALMIRWFGWVYWPIIIFIPIVGWARIIHKDHTVYQEIAGVIYSVSILSIFHNLAH